MPPPQAQRRGLIGWILRHPRWTLALVLLLLLAAACWLMGGAADRRLRRRIQALHDAGAPVTMEDLQARLPRVADEDNLTLRLLKALQPIIAYSFGEEQKDTLPYLGRAGMPASGTRMSAEQFAAAQKFLADVGPAFEEMHAALQLEYGMASYQWTSPAVSMLLPYVSDIRQTSRCLALETAVAAQEQKVDQLERALIDSCRVSKAIEHDPFLISALVAISCDALACQSIERAINLCPLSDAQLGRLDEAIRAMEGRAGLTRAIEGERVLFLDTVQWLMSNRGNALNALGGGPQSAVMYLPIVPSLDAAAGLDFYNRLMAACGEPDRESIRRLQSMGGAGGLPWYCVTTKMLTPSLSRAAVLWVNGFAEKHALRAALACERYRLAHGEWPTSLEAIVPDYLDEVPSDPFDGKPLRYMRIDEGIVVYSVGEDAADGEGDVAGLRATSQRRAGDAGWVLLDPELRGREATESGAQP